MKISERIERSKPDSRISFAFGNRDEEGGLDVICFARNVTLKDDQIKLKSSVFDISNFEITMKIIPDAEVIDDECFMEFANGNFISILFI